MRHFSFTFFLISLIALSAFITAQDRTAFLDVSVEDDEGNIVVGLRQDNFRLFIDGEPRKINSMQAGARPANIAWVVDVSASMLETRRSNRKEHIPITWAREGIFDFVEAARKDNKYFLITFAKEIQSLGSMNDADILTAVKKESNFLPKENKRTRLYDALKFAIEKAANPENYRQILFLLTDVELDYVSSTNFEDIKRSVKNKNLTVYVLLMGDPYLRASGSRLMESVVTDGMRLKELAEISGGQFWYTDELAVVKEAATKTAAEIQNQYRLGFSPVPPSRSDRKQKIELKLALSREEKKKIGRTVLRYRREYSPALEMVANNK